MHDLTSLFVIVVSAGIFKLFSCCVSVQTAFTSESVQKSNKTVQLRHQSKMLTEVSFWDDLYNYSDLVKKMIIQLITCIIWGTYEYNY